MTNERDFWYILCPVNKLKKNQVISRTILGTPMALFRPESGEAIALEDRCAHRSSPLSCGRNRNGQLTCPYHGWVYDSNGKVISIPSEGSRIRGNYGVKKFMTMEQDDYIYVCLSDRTQQKPFPVPHFKQKGYQHIRLVNHFDNTVTNCAENFVDVPHTTYVHPTIFRNPSHHKISARVERNSGNVRVEYKGEKSDFGMFNFFLNPKREEFKHVDEFFLPNITRVQYWFGNRHFVITSQSIPVESDKTLVYTDLTYNYGIWNWISKPVIRWQAQKIIDQDVEILGKQMQVMKKFGTEFQNSPCDIIHSYIESLRDSLDTPNDPMNLPPKQAEIEFWI